MNRINKLCFIHICLCVRLYLHFTVLVRVHVYSAHTSKYASLSKMHSRAFTVYVSICLFSPVHVSSCLPSVFVNWVARERKGRGGKTDLVFFRTKFIPSQPRPLIGWRIHFTQHTSLYKTSSCYSFL